MNPPQNIHLNNNNNNDNNNNNNNNINIIDQYAAAGGSSSVGEHGSGLVNRITALNSNRYSNFDRKTLTWTRVEPSSRCLPPSRSGAASVVVKGRLYMFGVSQIFKNGLFDFKVTNEMKYRMIYSLFILPQCSYIIMNVI